MTAPFAIRALLTIGIWALEATAVLAGAWLITLFIRKNAAMRHLTWLIAFCGLLLIPVFTAIVPSRVTVNLPAGSFGVAPAPRTFSERRQLLADDGWPTDRASNIVPANSSPWRNENSVLPERHFDWTPFSQALMVVWIIGGVSVIVKLTTAFSELGEIRRICTVCDFGGSYIRSLARKVGLARSCEVCISSSDRLLAAMTWGFARPVIVLPKEQSGWSNERIEAILLHELAHVRRCDSTSQLLALCACTVFWFNPAVWLGLKAMKAEAESAADDLVLRAGVRPSAYATELLRMAAELGGLRQPYAFVGVSIMKMGRIESRVKSIVDPANRRRGVTFAESMLVGGAGLVAVPLLASVRPTIEFATTNLAPPVVSVSALPPHTRSSVAHKSSAASEECPGPEFEAKDADLVVNSRAAQLAAPGFVGTAINPETGAAKRLPKQIPASGFSIQVRNETPSDHLDYRADDRLAPVITVHSGSGVEYEDKKLMMRDSDTTRREIQIGFGRRPDNRDGYSRRTQIHDPSEQTKFETYLPGANPSKSMYPPPTPYPVGLAPGPDIRAAIDLKWNPEANYRGPVGLKFEGNRFGPDTQRKVEPTKLMGPAFKWHPGLAEEIRGQLDAAEASLEAAIKRAPQRPEIIGQLKGILAGFRANKAMEMDRLLKFQPRPDEGADLDGQVKEFEQRVCEWARSMAEEASERAGAMQDLINEQDKRRGDRGSDWKKSRRGRPGPGDGPPNKTPN